MPIAVRKREIRQQARINRRAQENKGTLSRQIVAQFVASLAYQRAAVVMFYVDVRDEVRTRHQLPNALASGRRIVVPYCVADQLQLFQLEHLGELEIGAHQILEPKLELRSQGGKHVRADQLDLIMVPGVAFDRRGARLGHGQGYYDRLLKHVRPDAVLVGLAFECQVFPQIPDEKHDVFMDQIITEQAVYAGRAAT